jgi:hypothetical protein
MVSTLLDKATGWLGSHLITTILLPVVAFAGGVGALVAINVGWSSVDQWWKSLSGLRQILLCGGVVATILLLMWLIEFLLPWIIRTYEGYWPRRLGSLIRRPGVKLQTWRRDRSANRLGLIPPRPGWRYLAARPLGSPEEGARVFARYHRAFPHHSVPLLPTRLGNAMLAAEWYPNDRFGLDGVFFWPRLYGLLPEALLTPLGIARANLERMLVISSLSILFALVTAGFAVKGLPAAIWVPSFAGAVLLSYFAYRAAVTAAVGYGELIRTAFDTHRRKLLMAIGPQAPTSLDEERDLWNRLGQFLYRGDKDQVKSIRFGPAAP